MFDGESSSNLICFKNLLPLLKLFEKIKNEGSPGLETIHEQLTLGIFTDTTGKLVQASP
jgi:hypothetical protein